MNGAPLREGGDFVLYWMISARRVRHSFALEHAVARARALRRPLLVLEPLRVGYRWASLRHHRFAVEGMVDNARRCVEAGVRHLAYVEPDAGEGSGLLEALAERACVVVTDQFPAFFLPRMVTAAGARLPVRLEEVDGNGVIPLAWHERDATAAHSLRRALHKRVLADGLPAAPAAEPLAGYDLGWAPVPPQVEARWPAADLPGLLAGGLERLPIDQGVPAVALRGGAAAGEARLLDFLDARLERYGDQRNRIDDGAASGLSPYLHWGHLGAHEAIGTVLAASGWDPDRVDARHVGKREGFWGLAPGAEAFLDEALVWRELGFAWCHRHPDDHETFGGLPDWAQRTLTLHADDPRPQVYDLATLERGLTHDPLWNAAQAQLLAEGTIHNYLRMLWGKHVLAWSPTPADALRVLFELNNRWALDGRDPNSVTGITWCLGRFDRPWGPERPIFGTIRYMTSASTTRKLDVKAYVSRWTGWLTERAPRDEVSP